MTEADATPKPAHSADATPKPARSRRAAAKPTTAAAAPAAADSAQAKPSKAKAPSARVKPLNFRVTPEFRKAFKQAAAAEDIKKVELLERAFAAWQAAHSK